MSQRGKMHLVGLLIVLVVLVWPLGSIWAQNGPYPDYEDVYINDYANVINTQDEAKIHAMLEQLYEETDIEFTILTVNSYRDYGVQNETIEVFATGVFNTWGVGDAVRNDGVLLVVAVEDREVRIEVGSGYEPSLDAKMQNVIDEHMIPSFRRGDYSQGIYQGSQGIVFRLTGEWPSDPAAAVPPLSTEAGNSNSSSGSYSSSSSSSSGVSSTSTYTTAQDSSSEGEGVNPFLIGGAGIGIIGAGGVVAQRYARYRQRRCPTCRISMQRLDEVADDIHLSSGEQVEELLASIDYDVWVCPKCNRRDIQGYPRLFSGFRNCPKCRYRTLRVSSRTTVRATTHSTGEKVISRYCRHCKFNDEQVVVLPRIEASSSSSSSGFSSSSSRRSSSRSSFGGGKSKGGGASGKW